MEQSARGSAAQPSATQSSEGRHASTVHSRTGRCECTPDRDQGRGSGNSAPRRRHILAPTTGDQGQQTDTQLRILAAIQNVSDRLGRIEVQRPNTGTVPEPGASSHNELASYQEMFDQPGVFSLYAHDSLFGSDRLSLI